MNKGMRISLSEVISGLDYLPDRTPEMAFSGGAGKAFAELSEYRDGGVYVGYYSGDSEWERHPKGDEIVMALEGSTTLILRRDGVDQRLSLAAQDLAVVPSNTWHRFEGSRKLKVFAVTPQPSDHQLEDPDD
ncbi:MAG: cupin domain-containing protein [Arenicellales bacterium]|jgi:mannose-6-phosphate isomerase-like protein (cupin superfamily)